MPKRQAISGSPGTSSRLLDVLMGGAQGYASGVQSDVPEAGLASGFTTGLNTEIAGEKARKKKAAVDTLLSDTTLGISPEEKAYYETNPDEAFKEIVPEKIKARLKEDKNQPFNAAVTNALYKRAGLTDKEIAKLPPQISKDEATQLFTPQEVTQIQDPAGHQTLAPVPRGFKVAGSVIKPEQNTPAGTKQENFMEKQWQEATKRVNSLRQSSRSALGASAVANQRADRALMVLQNPDVTDQDLQNVVTDLAGIFHGGSPHEKELNNQEYRTLQTKLNNLTTLITATPQAAKQPAIQAKLKEVVRSIKEVDNSIVRKNLGVEAVGFKKLIASDPDRWNELLTAVNSTTEDPTTPGAPQGSPAPADPHGLTVGQKYPMKDGKMATYKGNGVFE